jgi:LuxR family maltose regulon positive regulatory protein
VAWVGIDRRHDEPGRLTRAVLGALADQGLAPESRGRRRRSDASRLDRAFDALGTAPWTLVLDDVHELRSREALDALRLLLDRAPPTVAVVMCSRADPPVAFGRLRLDGRLGEIRNADLEFTQDETADLLAAHGVDLRDDDLRALWQRTQGWVAGLRLAAGALTAAGDPHGLVRSAAATEDAIAEYLLEEVLDRQEPDVQRFLLRTSIVDVLTPDLAALLSGDDMARDRLDGLQRNGVFLTDRSQDGRYRYHALFAALLQACLRRRHPEVVGGLHALAAGWLERDGRPAEAERHARLAGDWTAVGRLATARWMHALLDDEPPGDLVAGAPPEAVHGTPSLALAAAADACARGDRDAADLHRRRLDELVSPGGPGGGSRGDAATAAGVGGTHRLMLDLTYGWTFGSEERSRDAARRLVDAGHADHPGHASGLRRLGRLRGAELDIDAGQLDAAVAALNPLADASDDEWISDEAAGMLALIQAANGNLPAAERRAVDVVTSAQVRDVRPTAIQAAHLATALHHAQHGERRNALTRLHDAGAVDAGPSRLMHAVQDTLRAALGGAGAGTAWLDSATAAHPLAAQVLIACGVLEVIDPERRLVLVGGPPERALVRAGGDLARGAPDAALAGLTRCLGDLPPGTHARTVVEARVMAALAASRTGRRDESLHHLGAALDLVATTGVRAPLLDRGAAVADLLDRDDLLAEHRGFALELLDHLRVNPGGSAAVDGLTERETAVLQYLPTLMSNAEIARSLHLSINTVKSHLKAVYRKLGAEGRRDAVLRGRELELI